MKRFLVWTVIIALVFTCAGCKTEPADSAETSAATTAQTTDATEASYALPEVTVENPATYVQVSIYEEDGSYRSLCAYDDGNGGAYVEYVGDVKKVGTFDLSVLHNITAEVENAGFKELDGQNVYEDGMASASAYVSYADESYLGAGFGGVIPQEFYDSYAALEDYFKKLVAHLPVYVPRPMLEGNVDEQVLPEIEQIIEAANIAHADAYMIMDVPMDENFGLNMGLAQTEGILTGTKFSAMMMTDPFSMVIAKLDPSADPDAVVRDFKENVDFYRWVCVLADNAMVAQKGDMVLCLIGPNQLYQQFKAAIEACGWSVLETLQR